MKKRKEGCNSYSYFEGETACGQLLSVRISSHEEKDNVLKLLSLIHSIEFPTTKYINGEIVRLSRYDIEPLYDEKGKALFDGFAGALEVKNPPLDRHGIIIYTSDRNYGYPCQAVYTSSFYEFEKKEQAVQSWLKHQGPKEVELEHEPGCIRRVKCGPFEPWFFAIADQEIINDRLLPSGFEEHGVFQFGRCFVVHDPAPYRRELPSIKTCWGVRIIEKESYYHERGIWNEINVYWHDGTISKFEEGKNPGWIEPLRGNGLLGQMVYDAAQQVATGRKDKSEVICADGSRVKVEWIPAADSKKKNFKGGRYIITVLTENGCEIEMPAFEFKPNPKYHSVEDYVQSAIRSNPEFKVLTKFPNHDFNPEVLAQNDPKIIEEYGLSPIKKILDIKLQPHSTQGRNKWVGFFPDPRDRNS